jgi:hypothetical protein
MSGEHEPGAEAVARAFWAENPGAFDGLNEQWRELQLARADAAIRALLRERTDLVEKEAVLALARRIDFEGPAQGEYSQACKDIARLLRRVLVSPDRAEQREVLGRLLVLFAGEVLADAERVENQADLRIDYEKWLDVYEEASPRVPVAEVEPLLDTLRAIRRALVDGGIAPRAAVDQISRVLAEFSPPPSPTDRGSDERATG